MFHGMVFLPVMLSFIGPKHQELAQVEEAQESNLAEEEQESAIVMLKTVDKDEKEEIDC